MICNLSAILAAISEQPGIKTFSSFGGETEEIGIFFKTSPKLPFLAQLGLPPLGHQPCTNPQTVEKGGEEVLIQHFQTAGGF